MALYELKADDLIAIEETTFATVKVKERADLQRLLRTRIETIVPDAMVIAEEFSNWDDSTRRIDLLAIDKDANLVVIELKRTIDGGHMELQAIRYAAMLSAMTWEQAVEAYRLFLPTIQIDADQAESRLLEFLEWEEPDEERFAVDVRIVLASADFSRELTTAVLWLNERGLDIRCVRMNPYLHDDRTLLDVQQVIPLPEAQEYQIRVREKVQQERASRKQHSAKHSRNQRFWSGLLAKANSKIDLHQPVNPAKYGSLPSIKNGIGFNYRITRDGGRIALWIQKSSTAENKAIFDELIQKKEILENEYGQAFEWVRNDEGKSCRVRVNVTGGTVDDESTWESLQQNLVAAMSRFFHTFEPHLQDYRENRRSLTTFEDGAI